MSIEFVRRIGKAEISTKHLNLTDINGKTYGAHFPPHKTKFIVIDQDSRKFEAQKHHTNQSLRLRTLSKVNSQPELVPTIHADQYHIYKAWR